MKKFNLLVASLILAVVFSTSCKKGENDPFLSLKSRKARVVGDWKTASWNYQGSENYEETFDGANSTRSYTDAYTITGSTISLSGSYKSTDSDGTYSDSYVGTGIAEMNYTFNNDGTFTKTITYKDIEYTVTDEDGSYNYTDAFVESYSGTWNFLGNVESNYKDKERMILIIESYSYKDNSEFAHPDDAYSETYGNGVNTEIWQLTGLSSSEMSVTTDLSYGYKYNYVYDFGATVIDKGTSAFSGSESGTLEKQ